MGAAMDNLEIQIGRIARELQMLERELIAKCGLPPLTPSLAAECSFPFSERMNSFWRDILRWVVQAFNTGEISMLRAPQPD